MWVLWNTEIRATENRIQKAYIIVSPKVNGKATTNFPYLEKGIRGEGVDTCKIRPSGD